MDLKIGVQQVARELALELADDTDRDALKAQIDSALTDPTQGTLWLIDAKGREVCVPAGKVAYIELGPAVAERRIGFGG